jgi:hypothetical protein
MTFPSFDTATSAWAPQANISWSVGPGREFEFVRFPNRLATEGEAMAYAVRMGEQWIDRRLKRVRHGIGTRRARMLNIIQGQRAETSPGKPHRIKAPTDRLRQGLSFDQFKSAIVKSGLDVKEELLRKSYAALVKVRSQQRLSWAQARKKVEHSQQVLKAQRRPGTARLPLTERDWQRIG